MNTEMIKVSSPNKLFRKMMLFSIVHRLRRIMIVYSFIYLITNKQLIAEKRFKEIRELCQFALE